MHPELPPPVARWEWDSVGRYDRPMRLPATAVYIHHSVTQAHDSDDVVEATDDPHGDARTIEHIGIERFGRGSYSYLFHPSGVELELAGTTVGAHTAGRNSTSFGLCLIGNYETQRPTDPQLRAIARRVRLLAEVGALTHNWRLRPHRAVKNTACPGAHTIDRLGELAVIIANPTDEEHLMPNPYQHLALVTLDVEHGQWPAGQHWFHVAGNTAVHVGHDGLAFCRAQALPEIVVTDGPGFLDAHGLSFGTA